jgi:SAM-dependent methyltransferase
MIGPNGRVVSVDTKPEVIESLKQRAADDGLSERIGASVCTDKSLGVDHLAGQIDFALAVYVVHHAADAPGLMAEVYSLLKPDGRFLIVEPKHHASPAECEAVESAARAAGFTIAGYPKQPRDWAAMLVKSDKSVRAAESG